MINKQKIWHSLFEASVVIKAINGAWETICGFAILLMSSSAISSVFASYNKSADHVSSGAKNLAGIYILAHGLINIFLAYHLYRDRVWAFWVSLVFFSASIVYLAYRSLGHQSVMLYALILFDIVFIVLTWHEYKYRKNLKLPGQTVPNML